MDIFPINIFPQGVLDSSVITTIWAGVLVTSFLNLRFGWTFSGIVVPGYLVPLLIAKPVVVVIIIVESFLAYTLVALFSKGISRFKLGCGFFGRDRFFAMLLSSVIVRIIFDGWLLPQIAQFLQENFVIRFDYQNNLKSFGLVIVALTANYFWKTGIIKGIVPFFVNILITYVITRYVLMEFTNFSIGNLEYMYENIATSFLASPKAYIIILTVSLIASWQNLYYGWEYGGIIIPSLFALQWYQPLKIVACFFEVIILLLLARLLLKLPIFKKTTIENARKVAFFFTISFIYKLIFGYLILSITPQAQVTNFYGIGYLLPAMIAIKMYDKNIFVIMTRTTLQTSFVAVLIASIIGFSLNNTTNKFLPLVITKQENIEIESLSGKKLISIFHQDKISMYDNQNKKMPKPTREELKKFEKSLKLINSFINDKDNAKLKQAQKILDSINYHAYKFKDQYLYLREKYPMRGWGIYILNLAAPKGCLIEVPYPLEEWSTGEIGCYFFETFNGKALAIAGSKRTANKDKSSDVLINPNTFYNIFHKTIANGEALAVRGYTTENLRILKGLRVSLKNLQSLNIKSCLYLKKGIPSNINLKQIKEITGSFDIVFTKPGFTNIQRKMAFSKFGEFFFTRMQRRDILIRTLHPGIKISSSLALENKKNNLSRWLLNQKQDVAKSGTELYKTLSQSQLLFFDEEILTPIIHLRKNRLTDNTQNELDFINSMASVMNYKVDLNEDNNVKYLVLYETNKQTKKYSGTYIFRLGESNPYVIQIPRPLYEKGSLGYGLYLFKRLKASVLMLSGAHPYTNLDGSADILNMQNKQNLFNLVNQVILRETGNNPFVVIQSRVFSLKSDITISSTDILFACADYSNKFTKNVEKILKEDRISLKYAKGAPSTQGYEVTGIPQFYYLAHTINKNFIVSWLSPFLKESYMDQKENVLLNSHIKALNIRLEEIDLEEYLLRKKDSKLVTRIPSELRREFSLYFDSRDIVILDSICRKWKKKLKFRCIYDINSYQYFLLIHSKGAQLPALINLVPKKYNHKYKIIKDYFSLKILKKFVNTRSAWLELRGEK